MQIWVDADACPVEAKEVLYKVVKRLQIPLTLVAVVVKVVLAIVVASTLGGVLRSSRRRRP